MMLIVAMDYNVAVDVVVDVVVGIVVGVVVGVVVDVVVDVLTDTDWLSESETSNNEFGKKSQVSN